MTDSCGCGNAVFAGMSAPYKRVLGIVIAINATMFFVETAAGVQGQSMALQADALDFLGDTATYALSLYVISKPAVWRARAALLKAISLGALGFWILGWAIYNMIDMGQPSAVVMTWVGALALAANIVSAGLLFRYRDGDANVRSVWICSRNDAIGNLAVIVAAGAVWVFSSAWPDVIAGALIACLFLRGAVQITLQSWRELNPPVAVTVSDAADPKVPSGGH
jgi:Co/Zn/Cd efflux system component